MTTSKQMRERAGALQAELEQVKTDLATANHDLQRAAGRGADLDAQALATQVTILQARQRAIEDAIKQARADLDAREKFIRSADYQAAQRKIGELEDLFEREAAAIFADLQAIGQRLQADAAKREEYRELLRTYGMESERPTARLNSRELAYLKQIETLLGRQYEQDKIHASIARANTPEAREHARQVEQAEREKRERNLQALRDAATKRGIRANYEGTTYTD